MTTVTWEIDKPSAMRAKTSADNSGSSVRDRMFSILRAPELLSLQRAAMVSATDSS